MSEQVVIRSTENGPNLIIVDGKVVNAWCRCGGSSMMPFCDGTHKKNGFMALAHEVKAPMKRQGLDQNHSGTKLL